MSFLGSIGSFFKKVGKLIGSAFLAAGGRGLTDSVVALALIFVKEAAGKFTDNTEKREYVVAILVKRGIPESIARLAVELAVSLFKKEIEKIPTPDPQV